MLISGWKGFVHFLHLSLYFSVQFNFPFSVTVYFIKSTWDLSRCNQFIDSAKGAGEKPEKATVFFLTMCPADLFCGSYLISCYITCIVGTASPLPEIYLFKNCLSLSHRLPPAHSIPSSNSPPRSSSFCFAQAPAWGLSPAIQHQACSSAHVRASPHPTARRAAVCWVKVTSSPLSAQGLAWTVVGHGKMCSLHSKLAPWTNSPVEINGETLKYGRITGERR